MAIGDGVDGAVMSSAPLGRMRRWKRVGVGGGDTTLVPLRVASCLISSRGVARKNALVLGGRGTSESCRLLLPLAEGEELEGMKVGTSSSHGLLTSG